MIVCRRNATRDAEPKFNFQNRNELTIESAWLFWNIGYERQASDLIILGAVLLADCIAAKIHFFAHYDPHEAINYFREHIVYWTIVAIVAFVGLVVEQTFRDKPGFPSRLQETGGRKGRARSGEG